MKKWELRKIIREEVLKHKRVLKEFKKDAGYYAWKKVFDKPFIVRGTKGNVKNELLAAFGNKDHAIQFAKMAKDAVVYNGISGEVLYGKTNEATYALSRGGEDFGTATGKNKADALMRFHLDSGYSKNDVLGVSGDRIKFRNSDIEQFLGNVEDWEFSEV